MPAELRHQIASESHVMEPARRADTAHLDRAAQFVANLETAATPDFSEDPGLVMTSCANCGAQMLERKCKLICSCGYFLSCSDYY
ncbi:MAG: hypothetical protein WCP38_01985 [Chloroflexota bacterium]